MVYELLLHGPVEVFKVALANCAGFCFSFRLDSDFQIDIKVVAIFVVQVWQRGRILKVKFLRILVLKCIK